MIDASSSHFESSQVQEITERISLLLVDLLHQDGDRVSTARLAAMTTSDWRSLLDLAQALKVRGLLYQQLSCHHFLHVSVPGSVVPPEIALVLQKAYWNIAQRNLVLFGALNQIVKALNAAGIRVIALKGAHLAGAVYPSLALREMADIDLLVEPEHLAPAANILEAQGYAPSSRYTPAVRMATQHHLPSLFKPGVAQVELHWTITQPYRTTYVDPAELWQRAVPVHLAGVNALGLGVEDLLLHICHHASYHHLFAFGLRPLCDIAEIARWRGDTLDWLQVMERARRWKWDLGVYTTLRLAQESVGAAIPAPVLYALRPHDFDDAMLATARAQILAEPEPASALSADFVRFWRQPGLRLKFSEFWRSLWISRLSLANQYGIAPESPQLYAYYLVRLKDLIARYRQPAFGIMRHRPAVTQVSQRKADILSWLGGEEGAHPYG